MPVLVVPVGDYQPDRAPLRADAAPVAYNVVPRTDGADGPLPGPVEITGALSTTCIGAFAARAGDGTNYLFAGTATRLQVQAGTTWSDRSAFTYSATDVWRFAQFGEQVVATDYNDVPQAITLGGAAFANLDSDAPKAKFVATIEPGFLFLGYYNDGTAHPRGLRWSGINDATSWPTIGTAAAASVQSDAQDLPSRGEITGILPAIGGAQAAIFAKDSIYRAEYIGPPQIFAFREVDRSRGCVAENSLVGVGPLAFFLSEDGFCVFDGAQVRLIGQGRVDRTFWNDVDQSALSRVFGTADYDRRLVIWGYPSAGRTLPNKWLIYSYATDRWRLVDDPNAAVEYIVNARQAGYTLDTLDTPLPGGPDSSSGFTVDSPLYLGGRRILLGFSTTHKAVSYEGSSLAARVETSDADSTAGRRVYVSGVRVLTDAASLTAQVGYRDGLDDVVAYTAATSPGVDGVCPQRISARYARARVNIPAATTWNYVQGVEVNARAEGLR